VALVADFNVPAGDGGARLNHVAAGAGEFRVRVPGMDFFFHVGLSGSLVFFKTRKIAPRGRIGQDQEPLAVSAKSGSSIFRIGTRKTAVGFERSSFSDYQGRE
jgi:hypothetical protein